MTKRFARVIVVNQDGQMLAVCQPQARTPNYCFPGGKVELTESPKKAAGRELYEELGLKVAGRHLRHCLTSTFTFGNETWVGYFYVCAYMGHRPTIMEKEKITSVGFYDFDDLSTLPCDASSFVDVARSAENVIYKIKSEIVNAQFFT